MQQKQPSKHANMIKYFICGAAAGLVNGFFGGGGGMVLVPLLTRWVKLEQKKAFASCVCIIAPMCLVGSIVYLMRGGLDFMLALPYLVGGLIGGIIAGISFKKVPPNFLHKLLAILILYGGVRAIFWS